MKRKIMIGSLLAVFLMMMLPTTNAIQLNTSLNGITKPRDFEDIRNMNLDELIELVLELAEQYPGVPEEIIDQIKEIKDEDIFQQEPDQLARPNASLRERIWLRIFNYRVFRLYLSLCLFAYFQSKLTLMRTMTWGIKLLRWVKVGIIIGVVDPSPDGSETPEIVFMQDLINSTLTVISVYPDNVLWSDIDQIGSGSCDPLPNGTVAPDDVIANCTGIIVLRYIPTNEVIDIFEFF